MSLESKIQDAVNYSESLDKAISGITLPNKPSRNESALRLFAIAHEHYQSMLLLLNNLRITSCATLLRPLLESYMRGLWIWKCATTLEIQEILTNKRKFKGLSQLIKEIKENDSIEIQLIPIGEDSEKLINTMHDLTHTGTLHIEKWNRTNIIEPKFKQEEIEEILQSTEAIGSSAVLAISCFSTDETVTNNVIDIINNRNLQICIK